MKLRTLLLAAGLGAGAVANRELGRAGGELDPALPGDQEHYRWRGMDVEYAALGDPDAPEIVLVHGVGGIGTSREFAEIAEALSEEYRVIAPDLPGYGRSDRPPLVYTAELYEEFLREFVADVAEAPTVIASSLSGGYAALAASDLDLRGLVLICPSTDTGGRSPLRRTLVRLPVLGTALYNAATSKPAIRYFGADHAYYDPDELTDDRVEYHWRASHQQGARYAPASFVSGYLDPDVDLAEAIGAVDAPVTLLWGRESTTASLREGRRLAERGDARLLVVDYARLLPHVEHPEETRAAIREELARVHA